MRPGREARINPYARVGGAEGVEAVVVQQGDCDGFEEVDVAFWRQWLSIAERWKGGRLAEREGWVDDELAWAVESDQAAAGGFLEFGGRGCVF